MLLFYAKLIKYLYKLNKLVSYHQKMNPRDFEGVYKWKFLIPGMYVVSWLLMIFGPIFFPYGYQIYCITIIAYSLLKAFGIAFGAAVALIVLYSTIKKLNKIKE